MKQKVRKNYTRFEALGPPKSTTQKLKFCQTRDTSDFKLEYDKIILRKFYLKGPKCKK